MAADFVILEENPENRTERLDSEQEFLKAAELGDTPRISKILQSNPDFDVDCVDILGRTALRLAVKNEQTETVSVLLEMSSPENVYVALLMSISLEYLNITEMIIQHAKYEEYKQLMEQPKGKQKSQVDDTLFSLDVTPLGLAAQKNQYSIVKLLLLKGESIEIPHIYYCTCPKCRGAPDFDELQFSRMRLNAFKGLCSPAYITLASKDPILEAFQQAKRMKRLSKTEKHYMVDYLELRQRLNEFVVKLLDDVRDGNELDLVLNAKEGNVLKSYEKLARLKLALHYKEKMFVAHPSCQKKLTSNWYEDWALTTKLQRSRLPVQLLLFFLFMLAYPFLAIVYMILPYSKVARFIKIPVLKFIANTSSYIIFVIMITVYSLNTDGRVSARYKLSENSNFGDFYTEYKNASLSLGKDPAMQDVVVRFHSFGGLEIVIFIWVLGLIWQDCKQLYEERLSNYLESWVNILDVAMYVMYVTAFISKLVARIKVSEALEYFNDENVWTDMVNQSSEQSMDQAYWLNADRFYWNSVDPWYIGDAAFAMANVLSISRLGYLLGYSEKMGPLVISLGRIIYDVIKFMCLFVLIMLAFIVGFANLFWFYHKDVRKETEIEDHGDDLGDNAATAFGDILAIFRTVYWSIFGMADYDAVELGDYGNTILITTVGYLMFGTYNAVAVIVMLNMLIAMMSRSFEKVDEDADVEWKFARSRLYLEFISQGSTLTVPFNLIPTWKSVYYTVLKLKNCCSRQKKHEVYEGEDNAVEINGDKPKLNGDPHNESVQGIEMKIGKKGKQSVKKKEQQKKETEYEIVMEKIVRRFLARGTTNTEAEEEDTEGGAIENLKQDMSKYRHEIIREVRRESTERNILGDRVKVLETGLQDANVKLDQLKVENDKLKINDELLKVNDKLQILEELLKAKSTMPEGFWRETKIAPMTTAFSTLPQGDINVSSEDLLNFPKSKRPNLTVTTSEEIENIEGGRRRVITKEINYSSKSSRSTLSGGFSDA